MLNAYAYYMLKFKIFSKLKMSLFGLVSITLDVINLIGLSDKS
jgi:hypothetical protein